uniref:ATP synthase F0 subunit 8 n=1 Tax=Plautia lushanica TaxID=2880903 RepID=UPI001D10840F|nr:ATP synthase F0 subunit 8 [Plautia lushanica]UCC46081.1 ATP synthase F0 subunit 8 [Plautia lushanica]
MPQMAPLWWEILFMMFILSFIMMIIMIYFSLQNNIHKKSMQMNNINQMNWMW